ncbi:MAG: hypothetical protein WBB17_12040 [Saprospiraceae bacterium]
MSERKTTILPRLQIQSRHSSNVQACKALLTNFVLNGKEKQKYEASKLPSDRQNIPT